MSTSIFLAKVLGLYLVILSIAILINPSFIHLASEFISNAPLMFLASIFALMIGILLVVSHNIWHFDWRIIITLFAWLSLIKGLTNIAFPPIAFNINTYFMINTTYYYGAVVITLLLGCYLCYHGFYKKK